MQGYSKNQRCVPPKVSEEKRNFKDGRNVKKVKMRIVYFRIIINTKSVNISINIKKSYEENNRLSIVYKFTTAQKMKKSLVGKFIFCALYIHD